MYTCNYEERTRNDDSSETETVFTEQTIKSKRKESREREKKEKNEKRNKQKYRVFIGSQLYLYICRQILSEKKRTHRKGTRRRENIKNA